MKQLKVQLDPQTAEAMGQTQASIQEWSTQYTLLMVQADGAKSTVQALYARRQGMAQKVIKESGIDPASVRALDVGPDGVVTITVAPAGDGAPAPAGADGPSDS